MNVANIEHEPDGTRLRGTWRAFWVGIALLVLGPLIGLLGTMIGMAQSFQRIETLPAPTPGDLAVGVHTSLATTTVGLAIGAVGFTLLVVSLVFILRDQSIRRRDSTPAV